MLVNTKIILALIGLCTLVACQRNERNDVTWTMWIMDGKSEREQISYKPFSDFNASYLATIKRVCPWNVVDYPAETISPETRRQFSTSGLTIREVSKWGRYMVLDCTNGEIKHKGIVLRDEHGDHWILYMQFHWYNAALDFLPIVHDVAGQSVLTIRTRVPGTGHNFIEYHFVISPVSGLPQVIDLSDIDRAISANVPQGWAVLKGGGLDFEKLRFASPIWQPGDGNCCPSGGRIDMKLELNDERISVSQVYYDATFDAKESE
jgi:hypothetical protein